MEYLNKEKFLEKIENLKKINPEHWGHIEKRPGQPVATERWSYHEKSIELLKSMNPSSILEAGSMDITLANESDTIDLDMPELGWRLTYNPTYYHDLTFLPWPIKDKQYDVFVALRVFHHMENEENFLKEMERISNHIILAFPESTAAKYEKIRVPSQKFHFDDTDTTILVYY